jgi:2-polyprenyl-6-methoxyphenol hydroxylase-like FAD-dependent oxidoreductase
MTGSRIQSVAVLGGGISGSVAAVALARQGTVVDLIEIATDWRGVGHGITLQGNALRALEQIGVADEVIAHGYPFNRLRLLKADGELLIDLETARTGGDHLPSTVGSLRSSLQQILCDAVHASGVTVRLGLSATALDQDDDGVDITFSDGTRAHYDLVIGADGIRSRTRAMIGIDTVPQPSGMSIWRIGAPRPAAMTCAEVYYGGPRYKAGYSPIAQDQCYAYMLDEMLDRESFGDRPAAAILRERSAGYGGIWGQIRAGLRDDTPVNYQWIEWLLVDGPWHRGRVVLIGDAVHACPPLIAQGAAMCVEDAVVLAEILGREPDPEVALGRFAERRLPRVRRVVEASLQLVEWEIHPDRPGADPAGVMTRTLASLVEPA